MSGSAPGLLQTGSWVHKGAPGKPPGEGESLRPITKGKAWQACPDCGSMTAQSTVCSATGKSHPSPQQLGQVKEKVASSPYASPRRDPSKESLRPSKRKVRYYASGASSTDVVLLCAQEMGWHRCTEASEADIVWMDHTPLVDTLRLLPPPRKLSVFPGMKEVAMKSHFAAHLNRMAALFPDEFAFIPTTYCLPQDLPQLHAAAQAAAVQPRERRTPPPTWIVKPSCGSGGEGIFLMQDVALLEPASDYIVQDYILRPLLINGYKFDFRIYVLVMSIHPLRIYIHEEGLVRLATEPYETPSRHNVGRHFMHLTNYSLNKTSEHFVESDGEGSGTKRTMSSVLQLLKRQGVQVQPILHKIEQMVIKTLISLQPSLVIQYEAMFAHTLDRLAACSPHKCMQVLGLDVMLDASHQPWLLELNSSPSLQIPDWVDYKVKSQVVGAALRMASYDALYGAKEDRHRRPKPQAPAEWNSTSLGSPLTIPRKSRAVRRLLPAASLQPPYVPDEADDLRRVQHEQAHRGGFRQIYPREAGPDYSALFLFNHRLREVFTWCCGVRCRHEMNASKFRKFAIRCGIVSGGTKAFDAGARAFSGAEVDLMFLKQTKASSHVNLGFDDLCAIILHKIAPRLHPEAETKLGMFMAFLDNNINTLQPL
mmetsp:Transcript_139000/g.241724  ORF Transcript_139000/g.241724 Transcript_139000/m.241724 type:complete len:652 (-) Transcript_139000:2016-3971(-)